MNTQHNILGDFYDMWDQLPPSRNKNDSDVSFKILSFYNKYGIKASYLRKYGDIIDGVSKASLLEGLYMESDFINNFNSYPDEHKNKYTYTPFYVNNNLHVGYYLNKN